MSEIANEVVDDRILLFLIGGYLCIGMVCHFVFTVIDKVMGRRGNHRHDDCELAIFIFSVVWPVAIVVLLGVCVAGLYVAIMYRLADKLAARIYHPAEEPVASPSSSDHLPEVGPGQVIKYDSEGKFRVEDLLKPGDN